MQTTLDFFNVVVMQINHKEKLTYVTKKTDTTFKSVVQIGASMPHVYHACMGSLSSNGLPKVLCKGK